MKQNYGALRVVRVRPPANATANLQDKYPSGWLPEERLVHLLTRSETTIGRALDNDIILMDPTVSREHARLVLNASGWHITNLTTHNVVRVNGRSVPSGGTLSMQPQDILILGSTMLQLIAPHPSYPLGAPGLDGDSQDGDSEPDAVTDRLPLFKPAKPTVIPDYSATKFSDAPTQWKGQKEEPQAPPPSPAPS